MAEADKIAPKTDCGIVMNTLCHDSRWHMNFPTHGVAAVPLGPPRQSKSHPTTLASAATNIFKSVGCQAPSNAVTPVKATELSLKKPDTSACSIKVQNISLHDNLFTGNCKTNFNFIFGIL